MGQEAAAELDPVMELRLRQAALLDFEPPVEKGPDQEAVGQVAESDDERALGRRSVERRQGQASARQRRPDPLREIHEHTVAAPLEGNERRQGIAEVVELESNELQENAPSLRQEVGAVFHRRDLQPLALDLVCGPHQIAVRRGKVPKALMDAGSQLSELQNLELASKRAGRAGEVLDRTVHRCKLFQRDRLSIQKRVLKIDLEPQAPAILVVRREP